MINLGQLALDLVEAWGDRALSVIELEERIATAAEKAPTDDSQIQALHQYHLPSEKRVRRGG